MAPLPPQSDPSSKFVFPQTGFHAVADKFREADFFLECLIGCNGFGQEGDYFLSAFSSAARSVTFVLQTVMSKYPNFDKWYPEASRPLRESVLARYFLQLRNEALKRGTIPAYWSGASGDDGFVHFYTFGNHHGSDLGDAPIPDVRLAARSYMVELASVLDRCYRDYDVYIDPRVIFTKRGLNALGWNIGDLLESLGFPRDWLELAPPDEVDDEQKLKVLSRYGGDEVMDDLLIKYGAKEIESQPSRTT
jgi:hypothetical protein